MGGWVGGWVGGTYHIIHEIRNQPLVPLSPMPLEKVASYSSRTTHPHGNGGEGNALLFNHVPL